jgi:hypothetical protein
MSVAFDFYMKLDLAGLSAFLAAHATNDFMHFQPPAIRGDQSMFILKASSYQHQRICFYVVQTGLRRLDSRGLALGKDE